MAFGDFLLRMRSNPSISRICNEHWAQCTLGSHSKSCNFREDDMLGTHIMWDPRVGFSKLATGYVTLAHYKGPPPILLCWYKVSWNGTQFHPHFTKSFRQTKLGWKHTVKSVKLTRGPKDRVTFRITLLLLLEFQCHFMKFLIQKSRYLPQKIII